MKNKIHYRFIKKGNPCWVFLHGWGGDLAVWDYLEKPITQKNYSFLSLDLPGHGLSFRLNKPLSVSDFAYQIAKVLAREKIKKVILVGHCFGGMVAQEFTLLFPQKVKKLILICTNSKLPWWSKFGGVLMPLSRLIKVGPKFNHRDYKKYEKAADISISRLYQDIVHVGSQSYYWIYQGIRKWSREKDLKKINCPVFIIGGKKDVVFPADSQKKLVLAFKRAKLQILNVNHIVPASSPDTMKELVLQELD